MVEVTQHGSRMSLGSINAEKVDVELICGCTIMISDKIMTKQKLQTFLENTGDYEPRRYMNEYGHYGVRIEIPYFQGQQRIEEVLD